MKLRNLHIENFGILSDYDYRFQDGLNVIKEDNGFGKTTLGAFIKVMFYGFENEGKLRAKRERLKYMPWQGGVYGGSLQFEHEGKEYKLSRTFGEDKKKDTFELIDAVTKLESRDFDSETIGEEIFDINGESFARTLFISQNEYSHSSFTDIDAKIGNLVEAADDLGNHDQAIKQLEKQKDEIGTYRRGPLKEIKTELDDLKNKVLGKAGIEKAMQDAEEEMKACHERILEKQKEEASIQQQMSRVAKVQDRQKNKKAYENLLASYEDSKEKYLQERSYFPGEIPSQGEIADLMEEARNLKALNTKMEDHSLSESDSKALKELETKYYGVNFCQEDLRQIRNFQNFWCGEREEIKNRIQQRSLSKTEVDQLKQEEARFKEHPVKEKENQKLIALWREHEAIKNRREEVRESSGKGGKKTGFLVGILAIAMGIFWLVSLSNVKMIGLLLVVIGVAVIILGVLKEKKKKEKETAKASDVRSRMEDTERQIRKYLSMYQIDYDPDSVEYSLRNLSSQYESYRKLLERKDQAIRANMEDGKRLSYMESQIKDFLARYGFPYCESNVLSDLNKIMEDAKILESYGVTRKAYCQAKSRYETSMKKLASFFGTYGFSLSKDPEGQLDQMKEHLSSYQIHKGLYIKNKTKKESFERDHENYEELLSPAQEIEEDALRKLSQDNKRLSDEITELEKQRMILDKRLNDLNDSYNEICECEERIAILKERKAASTEKKKILEKAMEHMEVAKNNLNAKYAAPIEGALKDYFSQLTKDSPISIDIDAKRQVRIKEQGASRPEESMSSGYKDLIDLCYRLALAKAMYPQESTLLVLDDPFSNLDEEKLEKGMDLIRKISENNQVLYFTCHASRAFLF